MYIPLGGNRRGEIRTYLNIFIVFVVSWLWHGAAFTFIIWRAIHSLILMIERFLKPYLWLGKVKNDPIFRFSIVVFTFTIVCVESKKFYSKVNLNLTNEISIKNVRIEKTNYSMCQITIGFDTKENVNSLGDYKLAVHAYLVSGNEGYLAEVNKKRNRKYDLTDIQLDYSDSIQFNFQTKINEFKNIEFFLFNSKGFDGVIGNTVKIRSSMKKEE